MKVSLNTIKQLTGIELPPIDELVKRINAQLGGVEEVIDLGAKYKDARIVKVVQCEKHGNADKLSVCMVDAGEEDLIQVICGANNVRAGMWAVWLPPQSTVPSSYDDAEPFVLEARELRGVMSYGMLASAKELSIGDDHDGIVELTGGDLAEGKELEAGAGFAKTFELDDIVIDIENKMFTHRPDLFGQLGVAREIAGIFGEQFEDPKWYYELEDINNPSQSFELKSFNDAGVNVPRLMLVGLDNIKVAPSPMWLRAKLVAMGGKPINNVVDVTNYVMLMSAQPTHAYDFDKLRGGTVGARMAKTGEKVKLLNDKTYTLSEDDIVIVDGEGPIGLGGVMGGGESEVSESTTRIVFECATFDMYTVRKTSMRYGLFTDALTRFNKGQSLFMNPYVMQYALGLLKQVVGADIATPVYDDLKADGEWRAKPEVTPMTESAKIETDFINSRLGLDLKTEAIVELLTNVGFECETVSSGEFSYWAPAWRMDIQDKEDVVEEVGRLYGFDKLPRELPSRTIKPISPSVSSLAKQKIRSSLSRAGANEVLTYSFVHENIFKKSAQNIEEAFKLSNALSPDLQYYRLTVLPSLLDKVHHNIKSGYDEFILFEIGKGHNKKYHASDAEGGLPSELQFVDLIYANKKPAQGAAFYQIRNYVDQLVKDFGKEIICLPIAEDYQYTVTAPFDLSRSAMVHEASTNEFIGMIGELKPSVLKAFKLPDYTAAATLDFAVFEKMATENILNYQPISKYPAVSQDVSLEVESELHYIDLFDVAKKALAGMLNDDYNWSLLPVSIYQGDDKTRKVITLRLKIESHKSTLTDQQVQEFIGAIVKAAKNIYGAKQK